MTLGRQPVREHTGISMGIAAMIVGFLAFLPALIAILVYSFLTVYAIVKAIGSAPKGGSPLTVLIGVVLIVTALATLLGGGVALIGRGMNPKKRRQAR